MNEQIPLTVTEFIDDMKTSKEWSLELATKYWDSADTALIIQNNEAGYNLGVIATPLASYLMIPVIVTDDITTDVQTTLKDLGVKKLLICGENISAYGSIYRFKDVDDIVDVTITLLRDKFGEIDYISITNPCDAWPPEVLDRTEITLGPETFKSGATTMLATTLKGGNKFLGTFTIPEDYKYCLVKFAGENLATENVDELGDSVTFACGPNDESLPSQLQRYEILAGGTASGGVPIRDANGNIIEDLCYNEAVLYDRGGTEYVVTAAPKLLADESGDARVDITLEKLSDPIYPMMKSLSTMAPYLTAYHKGIVFGKPEFAFAADDDILYEGQTCPGFYMPRRNPRLAPASNEHIYGVHEQINELLAKLAGIPLEKERDIEALRNHYKTYPVYVALVGGATVIPQYMYETDIERVLPPEEVKYFWGAGVPSDFIYGNIDPPRGEWSGEVQDLYSDDENRYPYQENIIGRVCGWDAQDVSALIARTVFYDGIIDDLGDWKDNAVLQMGGGNDFQKPFLRYKILGELLGMIPHGEPLKKWTGSSYLNGLALHDTISSLGFNTEYKRENEAILQGFTDSAITMLKQANTLNKLLLSKRQIEKNLGIDVVQGKELQENSNFILANAHGNTHLFTMGDVGVYKLGLGLPNGILERLFNRLAPIIGFGPGQSLGDHGNYNTRNVENMNLGPSFLWIESCITGKIDGVYPKQGVSQAFIHAGCNAVIAATTTSNVPGGYIEPKRTKYDFPGQTIYRYLNAMRNARRGIYPEQHFGFKIYTSLCEELKENDVSLGYAFRNARNQYLPSDGPWLVWWSPPLVTTGDYELDQEILNDYQNTAQGGLEPRMHNKYQSFYEYTLYGDPAFNPYVPTEI